MSIHPDASLEGKPDAGLRILLVEDDPSSQEVIRALCEVRGHIVDVASDGFMGLRLLSEHRHDLVLIDYHLPEMDGYALARLMREIAASFGRLRLIGITADGHGLASRRGADTLFDAILVKPIQSAGLFAAIAQLTQPVAAAQEAEQTDSASALWLRRDLSARPRALVCPAPSPSQAEAIGSVFAMAGAPEDADIVLVIAESGLTELRALRAEGPARLIPAIDLSGHCAEACDLAFQVGDPDAWSALARIVRGFSQRRASLPDAIRCASDPETRLLALLHVAERDLHMSHRKAQTSACCYETGHSPAARMVAILSLAESGLVICEPNPDGVSVRLTAAARHRLTSEPPAKAKAPKLDANKQHELLALVGAEQFRRLRKRLETTLETAFDADLDESAIAHQAHALISMAGNLGFDELAETCRRLQAALSAGSEIQHSLSNARRSCTEARKLLSA